MRRWRRARFHQDAYEPLPRLWSGRARLAAPSPVRFVAPDVIIRLRNNTFEVEVVEVAALQPPVNPIYHRLAAAAAAHPQGRVPAPRRRADGAEDGISGERGALRQHHPALRAVGKTAITFAAM